MLLKHIKQAAEGFATMAMHILSLFGNLRESAAQFRKVENGIVAEATIAARRFEDLTFHLCGDNGDHTILAGGSDHADKVGRTFAPEAPRKSANNLAMRCSLVAAGAPRRKGTTRPESSAKTTSPHNFA